MVLFFFALFVWPTQWRYFTLKVGTSEVPLRSHRLTDFTQRLTLEGWVSQDKKAGPIEMPTPEAPVDPQVSPPSKLQAGIEIQKRYVYIGRIHISVYNGSSEKLSALKLEVARTDGGAPRLFDVPTSIEPRESENIDFSSGLEDEQVGEVRLISVEHSPQ